MVSLTHASRAPGSVANINNVRVKVAREKKRHPCDWFGYSCAFPRGRVSFAYSPRALVRALRRRARPTSTRERRASARAYAIPTCSSRARASSSTPRAAVCAAHPPGSSRVVKKSATGDRQHSVPEPQSTPDAPNERTRGTPRGVPTISTCIRVTPTTSRVRFRSACISATTPCASSDPAWRFGRAERAVPSTGRAEHARRARAGLHPRVFRHASVSLTRYALRIYHSRSVAAGVVERRFPPSLSRSCAPEVAASLVCTLRRYAAARTEIRLSRRPFRPKTQTPRARGLGGPHGRWEPPRS